MRAIRSTTVVPLLVAVTVTASLTLSGCAAGLGESLLTESSGDQAGGLITSDVAVPAGWPDSVPLPPGTPLSAGTLGTAMTYQTVVSDQATAMAHLDAIAAAGFERLSETTNDTGGAWSFSDGTYRLTYYVSASDQNDGSRYAKLDVDLE
jgi:hypothetical protein